MIYLRFLYRTFSQLDEPDFRSVLIKIFGWSFVSMMVLTLLCWAGLTLIPSHPWVHWLGPFAALILSALLFPAFTAVVAGFYLEDIACLIEAKYYPNHPPARLQSFTEQIGGAVKLFLLFSMLNLLVLPLYFWPLINLIAFYAINGYLLSREYFELVALRRVDSKAFRQIKLQWRTPIFWGGVVIAFFASIPLINFFLPVIGTSVMLHLFEHLCPDSDNMALPDKASI